VGLRSRPQLGARPDAACDYALGALCWAVSQLDLPPPANGGYDGAEIGVFTPVKQPANGRVLDIDNRNCLLRGLQCLSERGFTMLTGHWRLLRHITANPHKIGDIVKAALVLTHFKHDRLA
jgi:hypothetical protein